MKTSPQDPFPLPDPVGIPAWLRASLRRYLCLDRAAQDCSELAGMGDLKQGLEPTLERYGIESGMLGECTAHVPERGPLLITANHPTGILDGVVLMAALLQRRHDVYILANQRLETIPHFADHHIPVEKSASASTSRKMFRRIRHAWNANSCVVHFPAGTVAHWQPKSRAVADAPAEDSVPRLAARLGVPHFHATLFLENPAWFHAVAAVSRYARTVLLIRLFYAGSRVARHPPVAVRQICPSETQEA